MEAIAVSILIIPRPLRGLGNKRLRRAVREDQADDLPKAYELRKPAHWRGPRRRRCAAKGAPPGRW